jgi:hypothetical protein
VPARIVDAVPRIPRPPLAFALALAALASFGLALLVGWLTAGTKEELQRATPLHATAKVPAIPLLGNAAPLPEAPKVRIGARSPAAPRLPRLIVGSG